MSDLEQLKRRLAELYASQRVTSKQLFEKERQFRMENLHLIAIVESGAEEIKTVRDEIAEIVINAFINDGVRPEYPLNIAVKKSPAIFDEEELHKWLMNNMPDLLMVNEKAVKAYVKQEGRITYPSGEILAGWKETPTLVAGETAMISWLDGVEFEEMENDSDE